jgi:hypothetical protein
MAYFDWPALAEERAKSGHALLGPSSLPRLMRCPGSLSLSHELQLFGKQTSYALEGSQAHYLAERCFAADCDAAMFLGEMLVLEKGGHSYPFTVDEEMVLNIQAYLDWCRELPGRHFIETKVSIGDFMPIPHQFGTADHAAIHGTTLTITDLKYGKGEQVWAQKNEQLMAYALGFYYEWRWAYDIDKVVIRVGQPRLDHNDVWECTALDLLGFGAEAYDRMLNALGGAPEFNASEKACRFCPVSGRCAHERAEVLATVGGEFDGFDEVAVEQAPLTELAESLDKRGLVKNWLTKLESVAIDSLMKGRAIPGWKLVEGKSNREWKDEKAVPAVLIGAGLSDEQIYEPREVISPAVAEKKLKKAKKVLTDHIVKPRGKPTLAPESDTREALSGLTAEFDNFETTTDGDD